jgi:hypothetical protein
MSRTGAIQVTFIFTSTPDLVAEGDRIFASHAKWMERTHYRDGQLALLFYSVVQGPEPSDPLDAASAPTGNINFVLTEVYATPAGPLDHRKQAAENWEDFGAFLEWAARIDVHVVHGSEIIHSLW